MAKRFTDTDKWKDPWFRKLPNKHKMFWLFILDNCDAAGILKIDEELFSFLLGGEITMKESVPIINKGKVRIKVKKESLFILEFAEFQYGSFRTSKHPFHKKLVSLIDKEYPIDRVSGRVCNTLQEEDKDKDKDKEEDKVKESNRFKKPTMTDLSDFLSPSEAEKFLDHYASNGWKVGRNTMKDWKATARNWVRRNNTKTLSKRDQQRQKLADNIRSMNNGETKLSTWDGLSSGSVPKQIGSQS